MEIKRWGFYQGMETGRPGVGGLVERPGAGRAERRCTMEAKKETTQCGQSVEELYSPYLPWNKTDRSLEPDVDYREMLKNTQNSGG